MTTTNELIERADMVMADLSAGGGILQPIQSKQFIDMVLDEPTMLPQCRVVRMAGPEVWISRIGIGQRILRAANNAAGLGAEDSGANGRYVAKADRSKATSTKIILRDSEVIAEVRLTYEQLEDNIEGQSLETHIMRLIAQQAALDLEEWALWADTGSGDAFMALQDGWMKRCTAHIADNLGSGVSPDLFVNALLALPQKYLKYLPQMRGFISLANTLRYRQKVSQRQTGYGDAAMQDAIPLTAQGLKLEGAPMMAADTIGASGLVTFPKNLIFGIRRDISVETDKDIRSREYIIVLTMRAGTQVDDTDATVKLINI